MAERNDPALVYRIRPTDVSKLDYIRKHLEDQADWPDGISRATALRWAIMVAARIVADDKRNRRRAAAANKGGTK